MSAGVASGMASVMAVHRLVSRRLPATPPSSWCSVSGQAAGGRLYVADDTDLESTTHFCYRYVRFRSHEPASFGERIPSAPQQPLPRGRVATQALARQSIAGKMNRYHVHDCGIDFKSRT
jgi:hypothetical protein